MSGDITVECEGGIVNIRVGAIIMQNGKFLMAGNDKKDYLYSVGGRVKFGETAEEAIKREVFEETGIHLDIDRLGFVHENFFIGDTNVKSGKLVYEISFYFYMKLPKNAALEGGGFTDCGDKEFLKWISFEDKQKIYPEFFKTELKTPVNYVKHFVTDER